MHAEHVTPSRSSELEGARADFLASLARRLGALRDRLELLIEAPDSSARRDGLLRRLSAMATAARVLGFTAAAEKLEEIQRALESSIATGTLSRAELEGAVRGLEGLPSLAWGVPASLPARPTRLPETVAPGTILVFGDGALADAIRSELPNIELEATATPREAVDRALALAPDAIVVDVDLPRAREAVDMLSSEGRLSSAGLVVVGDFKGAHSAGDYLSLGAMRALPKPASPEALRRALLEAFRSAARSRPVPPQEPIGDVTVAALVERVGAEVRRGLLDAVVPGGELTSVPLADGAEVLAAVWGAVARVREVVTLRSGGGVRFEPDGPEGAVPVAGWSAAERIQGIRGRARPAEEVALAGRRAVVVDDDPAVVWFLAGLLGSAGFEVLEAHDGRRALDLCWLSWPDLVISDVLMPGLDGFSLCREIKRDVAVRDTPVILLSWKEDLLQRLRELGADADGYLRKEASTPLFVERAREVLLPRARLEDRLQSGGEARGRLDGLTPRLVLELAGRAVRDARVSVRDAVHLYEIEVRDGAPRCATRTCLDGSFERGERVLAALLGVGAGRFTIEPGRGGCREDFDGSLQEVLAPAIRAARAATRALCADRLWDVQRVGLDMGSLAAYLRATPASLAGLVLRMANGTAPRALVADGSASPAVLEAVLADIARRGAVRSVDGRDGTDLLEQARLGLNRPAGDAGADDRSRSAEESAASQRFSFELSPAVGDAGLRECSMPPAACVSLSPQPAVVTPPPEVNASRAQAEAPSPTAPEALPVTDARARAPEVEGGPRAGDSHAPREQNGAPTTADSQVGGPCVRRVSFPSRPPDADDEPERAPALASPRAEATAAAPMAAAPMAASPVAASAASERPVDGRAIAPLPAARKIIFPVRGGPEERVTSETPSERSADSGEVLVEEPAPVVASVARARSGLAGTLRVAAITVGAAVVSFVGVSQLVAPASTPAPQLGASALAVQTPSASAPAEAVTPPRIEDLPLPVGVEASASQGLLEVVTREREAIYVQDTFMGTGPVRPVLLSAGAHVVRVTSDGTSRTFPVKVVPGRRTRLDVSGS